MKTSEAINTIAEHLAEMTVEERAEVEEFRKALNDDADPIAWEGSVDSVAPTRKP